MKGKISENELEEMQKSVLNLSDIIVSIKKDILDTLINFIDKKSINSNNDKLKLIKNLVSFKSVRMDIFRAQTITHLRHLFVLKKYPIGNRDNNRFRTVLMLKD